MYKASGLLAPFFAVALLALAGCAAPAPQQTEPTTTTPPQTMTIDGVVHDEGFVPIIGANVSLRFQQLIRATDDLGRFAFADLPVAPYVVDVVAPGFSPGTLTAEPRAGVAGLEFTLLRIPDPEPRNFTQAFHGFIECAMETLIIGPSCDTVVEDPRVGGPSVFNDNTSFLFQVESGWTTLVLDLAFKPSDQPGFEGMRITLRGTLDRDAITGYEQYGRFNGAQSFSTHVKANVTYPDATHPIPQNMTNFQADMYTQGRGWHALCQPPFPEDTDPCPLGVGAGVNVDFNLYVTAFYVKDPAPDWTFLRE